MATRRAVQPAGESLSKATNYFSKDDKLASAMLTLKRRTCLLCQEIFHSNASAIEHDHTSPFYFGICSQFAVKMLIPVFMLAKPLQYS